MKSFAEKSTIQDIVWSRVEQARRVSGEERLLAGLRHSDLSMRVVEDGIRHQFPDASDKQISQLLVERIDLMRRLETRR